ncbi:MAG: SDR family oxidoreductase, partial [Proteobacteria bacterium]|nr:SDR family oxidoreductase [Pseudomonadota bacterium]
ILVNNAGMTADTLVMRMSEQQWDDVLATNLRGTFLASKAALRPMVRERWGRIINITSVVGLSGNPGQANYAAAKAGIIGFTKALALEGAGRGITVNCIAPGHIDTGMLHSLDRGVIEEKLLPLIPVGRLGTAEDIARCVMFLVAPESDFLTGVTLTANGGQYMT